MNTYEIIASIINQILRDSDRPERSFSDGDTLVADIGLDSLDLAVLTITLEQEFGIDPFRDGRSAVSTFGELVAVYDAALSQRP